MSHPPELALGELLVEAQRAARSTAPENWSLNLDQIEPHTGRVLSWELVDAKQITASTFHFNEGTVLYSKLRPYLNKVIVADRNGIATTELVPLKIDHTKALPTYVAHFLRSPRFLKFATTTVSGAKMPRMVMSEFWKYRVPLPPIPEQRRIAAILDKADTLLVRRRQAIAQLDQLLQSVFLEMFGDPIANPSTRVAKLSSLCAKITDGTHQTPNWSESGIPFIFQRHVRPGHISLDSDKFISNDEYERLTARNPIEQGDVLLTVVGSYGNAALVRTSERFCFQRHVAHLKPSSEVRPQFLEAALNQKSTRRQADLRVTGIAQKTLTLREVKELSIPVPPLVEQDRFCGVYDQLRMLSESQKISEAWHTLLVWSLQKRLFR